MTTSQNSNSVKAKARMDSVLYQDKMNRLEAEWYQRQLLLMSAGEVDRITFESMKFRLADGTWYTPDFIVIMADGSIEAHEVKGFRRDDALVKFKVAAESYPWIRWIMVEKLPKKRGGGWNMIYDK